MTPSESVFSDFIEKLKNKKRLSNNDILFLGKVIYEYRNKQEEETLEIYMRVNYDFGKLDIVEGNVLTANKVHLTLDVKYQDFSLTDNGFLTIVGNSPKLGTYRVTIIEI
ncbi:MAG: hypothetical protein FWC34_01380 [Bacteroidetes bacterium]|nr:hypothetical protein [Bacteroidota bacterium]MCL2302492.1 hypothetical protein [Lentimicrobiaceae bacterium]